MIPDIAHFIPNQQRFNAIDIAGLVIYQCTFDKQAYHNSFFTQLGIYSPDSLNRAVDKRKSEFLAGRYCAKTVLAELGIDNFTINADKNRCPLWPSGIKGAITHSNTTALAAVTKNPSVTGVGIDIESVIEAKTMNDIQSAILHGHDADFLDSAKVSRETVFSLIFSIKESFFKAAYPSVGRYFDFDAVNITALDFDKGTFGLRLCQDLTPSLHQGLLVDGHFCFVDGQVLSLLVLS